MDISLFTLPAQEEIARKFGYTYSKLSSLIYPTSNQSYETFTIPKKNGEKRIINAPKLKLMLIQKAFANELTSIYTAKNCVHGFIEKRSIVTNAKNHLNKKYVLNIDLKDFFSSIHFGRIRNLLMSEPFNYPENKATILAQICCHNGKLPQGAPTSPILSNIICWKMDAQLQRLASDNRCIYTRYADDITFSFNVSKARLPHAIIEIDANGVVLPSSVLKQIIEDNGFEINNKKVRLQGRNQRQEVTGITVNKGPNLKRSYIRKTASMLYAWKKFGAIAAEREYFEKYRLKDLNPWQRNRVFDGEFFIDVLIGRINFIQMVKGRDDPIYRKLAYDLTVALGKPNLAFKKSRSELATFILENLVDKTTGTGFLLEKIGMVTNAHTVKGMDHHNYQLYKTFRPDEEQDKRCCNLIAYSKEADIAVLKPHDDYKGITPYKIGDDRFIKIGDSVTVVGFPGYLEGKNTTVFVAKGRITSRRQLFGVEAWLVDVPINHGCSGGPILNEKDEVIGIATFGQEHHDGSTEVNGFIPISCLNDVLKANTPALAQ